jgi:predicted NAD-dependent protein-ADP-ribosyltransferase YbiA (DUF1768 family)
MRTLLKDRTIVFIPEDDEEVARVAAFRAEHAGDVFELTASGETAFVLRNLGPYDDACRVPIDVGSRSSDPRARKISNFALAPFVLDGRSYASVEGFWQGLKFPRDADRRRIAMLHGAAAKRAGEDAEPRPTFAYEGTEIVPGSPEHWFLMQRACEAKFAQDEAAREALLATGDRPLRHRMRRDSRTIPGPIMSDIWMRVRTKIRGRASS